MKHNSLPRLATWLATLWMCMVSAYAADVPSSVQAYKDSGRLASPTNLFYTNIVEGTNIVFERLAGGRLKIHGTGGGGGGVSETEVTNIASGLDLSLSNALVVVMNNSDAVTSNALRTLLFASDITTSNGIINLHGPQIAGLSNAIITASNFLYALNVATTNGLVSLFGPQIAGLTNISLTASNMLYAYSNTASNFLYWLSAGEFGAGSPNTLSVRTNFTRTLSSNTTFTVTLAQNGARIEGFITITNSETFTFDGADMGATNVFGGTNGVHHFKIVNDGTTNRGWVDFEPVYDKGTLFVGNRIITTLAPGSDGQIVVADSTATDGLKWTNPPTVGAGGSNFIAASAVSLTVTGNVQALIADLWPFTQLTNHSVDYKTNQYRIVATNDVHLLDTNRIAGVAQHSEIEIWSGASARIVSFDPAFNIPQGNYVTLIASTKMSVSMKSFGVSPTNTTVLYVITNAAGASISDVMTASNNVVGLHGPQIAALSNLISSGSVPLSNSVFVSASGDDATGQRGNAALPFRTITNALAATLARDTIFVFPGDYIVSTPLWVTNSVNFKFEGVGSVRLLGTDHLFGDDGGTQTYTNIIYGPLWNAYSTNGKIWKIDNNTAFKRSDFTFGTITNPANPVLVYLGTNSLRARVIGGSTPVQFNGGDLTIEDSYIFSTSVANDDAILVAGHLVLKNSTAICLGSDGIGHDSGRTEIYNSFVQGTGGAGLTMRGSGTVEVWNSTVLGKNEGLFVDDSLVVNSYNSVYQATNSGGSAVMSDAAGTVIHLYGGAVSSPSDGFDLNENFGSITVGGGVVYDPAKAFGITRYDTNFPSGINLTSPIVTDLKTNAFVYVGASGILRTGIIGSPLVFDGGTMSVSLLRSNILYVDKRGSDANSGSLSAPFLTLTNAVAVANTLGGIGTIDVGVGTFSNRLAVTSPRNWTIRGQGWNTIIGSTNGQVLVPADNCALENFTVMSLTASNEQVVLPLGCTDALPFTNAMARNLRIKGFTDGVTFSNSTTNQMDFYNCLVESSQDSWYFQGSGGYSLYRLYQCRALTVGPVTTNACAGSSGLKAAGVTVRAFGCDFSVTNTSPVTCTALGVTVPFASGTTIELYECTISAASPVGALDIYNDAGGAVIVRSQMKTNKFHGPITYPGLPVTDNLISIAVLANAVGTPTNNGSGVWGMFDLANIAGGPGGGAPAISVNTNGVVASTNVQQLAFTNSAQVRPLVSSNDTGVAEVSFTLIPTTLSGYGISDTIGNLESAVGSVNIIVATEIDTSAELAGIIGDETGSGNVVFSNAPIMFGATLNGTTAASTINSATLNNSGTLTSAVVNATSANISGTVTGATATVTTLNAVSGNISGTVTGATATVTTANITGTATAATLRATSGQITGTHTAAVLTATSGNISGTITAATVTATSGNISGTVTGATLTVTTANITGASTSATHTVTTLNVNGTASVGSTNLQIGLANLNAISNKIVLVELGFAASDEITAITAGTAKVTLRMPYAMTLTSVRASLTTAQASGSIFTVDINESGTTILSTKITIDNTEKTSTTAAAAPVLSDTALADDAEITVDVDQIGTSGATGLKIWLIGSR